MQATPSGPERRALEAADVGARQPRGERGILAEGAADARPARLGGEIGHAGAGRRGCRRPAYSWRAMSPNCSTRAWSPAAARPSGSGHCEKCRACRRRRAGCGEAWRGSEEKVTGMPSRVVGASCLQRGCATRPSGRRRRHPVHVEVGDAPLAHELTRAHRAEHAHALEQRAVHVHRDRRVEEEADLLIHRHARQQALDPLRGGVAHPPEDKRPSPASRARTIACGAVGDLELREDVRDVVAHGLLAEHECRAIAGVVAAARRSARGPRARGAVSCGNAVAARRRRRRRRRTR